MSSEKIYFEAEEKVLNEIAHEKKPFSFRAIIRLITAGSIARKL